MEVNRAVEIAKTAGFETALPIDPKTLKFLPEVRDMCKACRAYGKKWVCPPGCGSIEEMELRYHRFNSGVAVQTVWNLEDGFDLEGMTQGAENHKKSTSNLLSALAAEKEEILPFGNDGCGICEACTYPDEACRFPDRAYPSLESVGIMVSDMCKSNGITYYYGRNTVALTGAFLFNPEY